MDLFVLGTIAVVFLVLLIASLLVNKMPSGKTFEEVQKEKRQLADQMKQQSRPSSGAAKQKGGGGGHAAQNAGKQKNAGKQQQQAKAKKAVTVAPAPVAAPHVEFVEEQIYLADDMPVIKKSLSGTSLNKQAAPTGKKNKNKTSGGILVNKGEPVVTAKAAAIVAEPNHFEEIHPKDDVEMLKAAAQKEEQPAGKGGKPHKNAVNELRKEKKAKNKSNAPKTASSSGIVVPSDVADIEGVEQILRANEQKLQQQKRAGGDAVDSVNRQRRGGGGGRSDGVQALQKLLEGMDEISVNVLIMLLAKAELSRGEIQVVIDYLLNKQSDGATVIQSEWTEGKQDLVARLKRQLAERETALEHEREAAQAVQEKLRLLRVELNAERTQNGHTAKMYMWEMAQKEKELEGAAAKVAAVAGEKAALLAQMQKMQLQLVQQKAAMGVQEEHQRQLQQLQEANGALQRELEMYKNTVQVGKVDLRNLQNELDSARNEILQLHQKSFEVAEQATRELAALKVEVASCENALADKKAAIEQLEAEKGHSQGAEEALLRQLAEQKQAVAALQADLAAERQKAQEQAGEAQEALLRQLEEQKQKNNDLRTTNWKLMEAVTAAEKANAHNDTKNKKDLEVLTKERVAQAEKELRDKFTHMLTQISVFSNLKLDSSSSSSNGSSSSIGNGDGGSSNGTSSPGADLEEWMGRVTEGLKKKLDVYESLLGALKNQLQDKREKEMLQATATGKKNGNGEAAESNGNGTAELST